MYFSLSMLFGFFFASLLAELLMVVILLLLSLFFALCLFEKFWQTVPPQSVDGKIDRSIALGVLCRQQVPKFVQT